ncbi:putative peptidase M48 [Rosa chinensis]|uniref:Putative peptidase M48 n=1 Tax=Rosa chinensis TaxID=74649 RepID=A0A2P6SMM3_ROSCH|nr:putative peptidase M48 [Rosa chinensis]
MNGEEGKMEGECSLEDEKKGKDIGVKDATSHLVGLNWEVLVVDEPIVNAYCLPGGKIVVFTGLILIHVSYLYFGCRFAKCSWYQHTGL